MEIPVMKSVAIAPVTAFAGLEFVPSENADSMAVCSVYMETMAKQRSIYVAAVR